MRDGNNTIRGQYICTIIVDRYVGCKDNCIRIVLIRHQLVEPGVLLKSIVKMTILMMHVIFGRQLDVYSYRQALYHYC